MTSPRAGPAAFPRADAAPAALLGLDGNCGPMSVWLLLRHLRRRTAAGRVIRLCRHSHRSGTHTIALAVALRDQGLRVDFHTDDGPRPTPLERRLYRTAARSGVAVGPALDVDALVGRVGRGEVAVVGFDTDDGDGHFSPVVGVNGRRLVLPYTEAGDMDVDEFDRRWRAPGLCRQCAFAARPYAIVAVVVAAHRVRP